MGQQHGAEAPLGETVDYYADRVFWNSFPTVRAEINRRTSGDATVDWIDHASNLLGGRRFRRALVLNCGNGWVERGLIRRGLIESAVGIDLAADLVEEARSAAESAGLALEYRVVDTNEVDFADEQVDLVVNHAALHHVRYLDRVVRACADVLSDDGRLISYDYVGAHRNQWSWEQFEAARALERSLPEQHRTGVGYPHLPTMLVSDPTEAVHSELIREVVGRHFELDADVGLGGALAYPVLADKRSVLDAPEEEREAVVADVLAADQRWHDAHPEQDAFWFAVGRPRRHVPSADLDRWTAEEEERERQADAHGGAYGERTVLQDLVLELADAQVRADHHLAYAHQVMAERDEARARLARVEEHRLVKALQPIRHAVLQRRDRLRRRLPPPATP